ncbi:hypothetical protein JQN70_04280 [Phycicoccus sp. MQZ13P-5]|uniref:Uncharacterized protein n=1 Tax=Phycicoccus sonneratiae TaxID=2807628 RepID=A0ABS2CIB4_9MICO|nr:hypothetical protein [Phycicoccus sonneraticus]
MARTVPVLGQNVSVADYEYLVLVFGRDVQRQDIRRTLTEHAEYGHWELARTRTYMGGLTRTWLRRRIIRARRSVNA